MATKMERPSISAWLFCVIAIGSVFAAAWLPDIGPVPMVRNFYLVLFRSILAVRMFFIVGISSHVVEAIYAWHLAKTVDPSNSTAWFWQTLGSGMFSLRFLLKKAKNQDKAA